MWPPTITDCECTEPGFCRRHQCVKGYWQHRLCRRQPSVFEAYEKGIGPGQNGEIVVAVDGETSQDSTHGPGLLQRGLNFAKASVRHVASGMTTVTDEVYEGRLTVCRNCEFCDLQHLVCLRPECGCFLNVKAKWASESCPAGKWSSVNVTETK
ncbi:MAG: DUF6171 family protein [Planctomycetaceae bacterium]